LIRRAISDKEVKYPLIKICKRRGFKHFWKKTKTEIQVHKRRVL